MEAPGVGAVLGVPPQGHRLEVPLVRLAEALAELHQHPRQGLGVGADHAEEFAALEREEGGGVGGGDGGRARAAIEEGDLAEEVSVADRGHHDLLAVGAPGGDLRSAREEHVERLALVPLGEDHLTGRHRHTLARHREALDLARVERLEEGDRGEDLGDARLGGHAWSPVLSLVFTGPCGCGKARRGRPTGPLE